MEASEGSWSKMKDSSVGAVETKATSTSEGQPQPSYQEPVVFTTTAAATASSAFVEVPSLQLQQEQQRRKHRVMKGAIITPIGNQQQQPVTNKGGMITSTQRPVNAPTSIITGKNPSPVQTPTSLAKIPQPPTKSSQKAKNGKTTAGSPPPTKNTTKATNTTNKNASSSFVDLSGGKNKNPTQVEKSSPSQAPAKTVNDDRTKMDTLDQVVAEVEQPVEDNGGQGVPNKRPSPSTKTGSLPTAPSTSASPHSTESPPIDNEETAPSTAPQSYLFPPDRTSNTAKTGSSTQAASTNGRSSCPSRHKNSLLARLSCQASSTWSTHPIISTVTLILLMFLLVVWKRCCCGRGSGGGGGGGAGLRPRRDHRGEYRQLTTEFGDNPFNDDVSDYMEDGDEFDDFDDEPQHGVDYYHQQQHQAGKATVSSNGNHAPSRGIELARMDHKLSLEEVNG